MVSYAKRFFVGVLVCASAIGVGAQQVPAELKGKTVSIVIPASAGGNVDALARTMIQKIEQKNYDLKFIVLNRGGAGGALVTRAVVESEPDGLVIGQLTTSMVSLLNIRGASGSAAYGDLSCFYHAVKWPSVLFVHNDAPFNNFNQMIEYLKSEMKPAYGFVDVGTAMLVEAALQKANLNNVANIPYKGIPDVIRAVLSKDVVFSVGPASEVVSLIREGKLKAIFVGTREPSALLPSTPSIEAYLSNILMENAAGYCVNKNTPRKIIDFYNAIFEEATKSTEYVDFLRKRGQIPIGGTVSAAQEWYERSWKDWRLYNMKYGNLFKN